MTTWETVCRLGARLPGVQESTSYGTPALKVDGRLMARLLDDDRVAIFTIERDALLAADPDTFTVPAHYEKHPMVVVRLASVDETELGEVLTESWRLRARRSGRAPTPAADPRP